VNNDIANLPGDVPDEYFINGLYTGAIPNELKDLTFIEISMISINNPITKVRIEGL
jgi:hypothetical protein